MSSHTDPEKIKEKIKNYLYKTRGYLDKEALNEVISDTKIIESLINNLEDVVDEELEVLADKFEDRWQRVKIAFCSENLRSKNPKISPERLNSLCETLNDDEVDESVFDLKERLQTERLERCSENLKAKNPKISPETVTSLCETVNGILGSKNKRDIPEKLDSLLHQWFNDDSILEEIYKTINSKDLCFLHEVNYDFRKRVFYLQRHIGRDNPISESIFFKKYYEDQIEGCESNLMAINFSYFWPGDPYGHSTIVVIERGKIRNDGKQLIEVEHFDSSNIDGEQIKAPLENFIKSLFDEEKFYLVFHHQDEVCNFNIQGMIPSSSKFSGSCTQFAMWYGFKRLLEPHRTRHEVVSEMKYLLDNYDPETVMINLIKQFQSLLTIKTAENDNLKMKANGRNLEILSANNKLLNYQELINEFDEKMKKFDYALDRLSKSHSENDFEDVKNTELEVDQLGKKIIKEHGMFKKSEKDLQTKWKSLHAIKMSNDAYISYLKNKEFGELLNKFENAINKCKTSYSNDAYSAASNLLSIFQGDYFNNITDADLVAKYERLVHEYNNIINPKKRKNIGGTKRKKLQRRKQKSWKRNSSKKLRH